jgi:protein SCO1/2
MAADLKDWAIRKCHGRLAAVIMLWGLLAGTAGLHALLPTTSAEHDPPKGRETIGGPFALVDARHLVTDRIVRGRYLLVYFGYTGSPKICPTTLNAIARAVTLLGPRAADVQPVYITIGPQRDAPAGLGHLVDGFSAPLVGLTGSPAARQAVENAYHVVVRFGRGGMDRKAVLYLMAPNGEFLTPLPADGSAAIIAADLNHYLG